MPTIAQLVGQDVALIEHHHPTTTFAAQRQQALVKQRSNIQARLDNLRKEIRKVQAKAETGVIDLAEGIAKLERMNSAEAKLVQDIARLTDKVGA